MLCCPCLTPVDARAVVYACTPASDTAVLTDARISPRMTQKVCFPIEIYADFVKERRAPRGIGLNCNCSRKPAQHQAGARYVWRLCCASCEVYFHCLFVRIIAPA